MLQAEWLVPSSREDVLAHEPWNQLLREQLPQAFISALSAACQAAATAAAIGSASPPMQRTSMGEVDHGAVHLSHLASSGAWLSLLPVPHSSHGHASGHMLVGTASGARSGATPTPFLRPVVPALYRLLRSTACILTLSGAWVRPDQALVVDPHVSEILPEAVLQAATGLQYAAVQPAALQNVQPAVLQELGLSRLTPGLLVSVLTSSYGQDVLPVDGKGMPNEDAVQVSDHIHLRAWRILALLETLTQQAESGALGPNAQHSTLPGPSQHELMRKLQALPLLPSRLAMAYVECGRKDSIIHGSTDDSSSRSSSSTASNSPSIAQQAGSNPNAGREVHSGKWPMGLLPASDTFLPPSFDLSAAISDAEDAQLAAACNTADTGTTCNTASTSTGPVGSSGNAAGTSGMGAVAKAVLGEGGYVYGFESELPILDCSGAASVQCTHTVHCSSQQYYNQAPQQHPCLLLQPAPESKDNAR